MSASERKADRAASEAETRLDLVAVQSIVVSCSMAVGLDWIRVEHRVDVVELDQYAATDLVARNFPILIQLTIVSAWTPSISAAMAMDTVRRLVVTGTRLPWFGDPSAGAPARGRGPSCAGERSLCPTTLAVAVPNVGAPVPAPRREPWGPHPDCHSGPYEISPFFSLLLACYQATL